MFEAIAPLTVRRQVSRDMFVLGFAGAEIAEAARPGQFVNLKVAGPLLRRPFSVFRADRETVEVLVRGVGEGTDRLLALGLGDAISILGPLGRPFDLDPAWGSVTLVSGGLGAGPMPITAAAAAAIGLRVVWAHGARTAQDLCREAAGDEVVWATDDGSRGHHGSVLDAVDLRAGGVIACGPNPMLAALAARRPDAQVAVETYMGCGTGVCLGCAVPMAAGAYTRACVEGPVYRAADIAWPALPGHLHYTVGR